MLSGPKVGNKAVIASESAIIRLPEPRYDSQTSIERALLERRSVRDYSSEGLSLTEVSQLLWAAQGITDQRGFRTAPSAGALYPLELYLVTGNVLRLEDGIYRYQPAGHKLVRIVEGDKRVELSQAALGQYAIKDAPAVIVFSAYDERTTKRYKARGLKYIEIEVGHVAQNIYLQAVSLKLGTVAIGAFDDDEVKQIISMDKKEMPLYIMPVGRKRL